MGAADAPTPERQRPTEEEVPTLRRRRPLFGMTAPDF